MTSPGWRVTLTVALLVPVLLYVAVPTSLAQSLGDRPGDDEGAALSSCRVNAFLTCGWAYLPSSPPRSEADGDEEAGPPPASLYATLFPTNVIGELEAFPAGGTCTAGCLQAVADPRCSSSESEQLMSICDSLACAASVRYSCGVSRPAAPDEYGAAIDWDLACSEQCAAAMASPGCRGVDGTRLGGDFARYRTAFGPGSADCRTWRCASRLAASCGAYSDRGSFSAEAGFMLQAGALCDAACWDAFTGEPPPAFSPDCDT